MSNERAILHVLDLQHPLPVRLDVLHVEVQSFAKEAMTERELRAHLDALERKRQVVQVRTEEGRLKAKITDAGKARLLEGE
jgi:hypothetical protein